MRLLICTQAVDSEDQYLGFFVRWIAELAKHYEHVHVICLKEGSHVLPQNVSVHSLGKEGGRSRVKYVARFFRYIWSLRREYDAVFVHMNQEYVLLGAKFWFLSRTPIYMWRNHGVGSVVTDIAAAFCTKVFCTSKYSYTAKYKKTILMSVGVDTEKFKPDETKRKPRSILYLGRIAPAKHPEILIEALSLLKDRRVICFCDMYGPGERVYIEELKKRARSLGLEAHLQFFSGVRHRETSQIYQRHDVYVNAADSGMYDKTIFEAAASGCIVFARSHDFAAREGKRFAYDTAAELAQKLEGFFAMSIDEQRIARSALLPLVEENSLHALADTLVSQMS